MKHLILVLFAFFYSIAAAKGIEGVWVGNNNANHTKGLTLEFLPNSRWQSSYNKEEGLYVVDGNSVTVDRFFGQRVKGRLSGDKLVLVVFYSTTQPSLNYEFSRGNVLDHADATQDMSVRLKVSEMVLAMSPCRLTIHELYQYPTKGATMKRNGWGCESKHPYGTVETSENGKIIFRANRNLGVAGVDGNIITLTPLINGKQARYPLTNPGDLSTWSWRCGAKADLEAGQTMVDSKFLPQTCMGNQF